MKSPASQGEGPVGSRGAVGSGVRRVTASPGFDSQLLRMNVVSAILYALLTLGVFLTAFLGTVEVLAMLQPQ